MVSKIWVSESRDALLPFFLSIYRKVYFSIEEVKSRMRFLNVKNFDMPFLRKLVFMIF